MSVLRLVTVATLITAFGCGGGGGGDGGTPPTPPTLASLTITPDPVTLVNVGDETTLAVVGKNASGGTIATGTLTWTTSNSGVATVDGTGKVKAVGLGSATITATASNSVAKSVVVSVTNASFNVQTNDGQACTNPVMRPGKLVATSAHALFIEDTGNPTGGFTTAEYDGFASQFESLVWPVLTENFGTPTDIDNNGRVIVFFTRAVNELSPANSNSVVGGFFFARDLFPKVGTPRLTACAGSNVAEMFYMLVPDPNGTINGNVRPTVTVKNQTVGVIGHEFQHLINSATRLYKNLTARWPEATFMEEGLSHIAEELLFYRESGLSSMSNIDLLTIQESNARVNAFNSHMSSNAGRYRLYLDQPSTNSPYADDDELETRGATWSWLRYLADVPAPSGDPACAQPVSLAVGGICHITAPSQVDLKAGATGEEFTLVAVAEGGSIPVTAAPTAVMAVTGPPSPYFGPMSASFSRLMAAAPLREDWQFHGRLREMERRELRGRVSHAREEYVKAFRGNQAPGAASFASLAAEDVWAKLVNSNDTSFANLDGVFGAGVKARARDWATANYTDDALSATLAARYTHPSWNWRSIMPLLNGGPTPGAYSLRTLQLTSSQSVTLMDGGSAYFRAGVAPTVTARVTFTSSGGSTPSGLKLVVVRTK